MLLLVSERSDRAKEECTNSKRLLEFQQKGSFRFLQDRFVWLSSLMTCLRQSSFSYVQSTFTFMKNKKIKIEKIQLGLKTRTQTCEGDIMTACVQWSGFNCLVLPITHC